MKLSLATLAATLAVASAADCEVAKLASLLPSPNVATCKSDSGFLFTAPSKPTGETLTKICASTACQAVLTVVKSLNLGDCTLVGMRLETNLLTPIDNACGTGSNSTVGGNMTNSNSDSSDSSDSDDSKSKSGLSTALPSLTNTPAPISTPAPTSGASSSVALATSAVVVAIAAAIF